MRAVTGRLRPLDQSETSWRELCFGHEVGKRDGSSATRAAIAGASGNSYQRCRGHTCSAVSFEAPPRRSASVNAPLGSNDCTGLACCYFAASLSEKGEGATSEPGLPISVPVPDTTMVRSGMSLDAGDRCQRLGESRELGLGVDGRHRDAQPRRSGGYRRRPDRRNEVAAFEQPARALQRWLSSPMTIGRIGDGASGRRTLMLARREASRASPSEEVATLSAARAAAASAGGEAVVKM